MQDNPLCKQCKTHNMPPAKTRTTSCKATPLMQTTCSRYAEHLHTPMHTTSNKFPAKGPHPLETHTKREIDRNLARNLDQICSLNFRHKPRRLRTRLRSTADTE